MDGIYTEEGKTVKEEQKRKKKEKEKVSKHYPVNQQCSFNSPRLVVTTANGFVPGAIEEIANTHGWQGTLGSAKMRICY
jgi:hypothetical protein